MIQDCQSYLEDWEFHQATGMLSVQIGTHDMFEAAMHLIALAARRHESPHDTAVLVIARQVELASRQSQSGFGQEAQAGQLTQL